MELTRTSNRLGIVALLACLGSMSGPGQIGVQIVPSHVGPPESDFVQMPRSWEVAPLASSVPRYPALNYLQAVVDAPFSAVHITEVTRVLRNGQRNVLSSSSEKICRDSQGRTRMDRPLSVNASMPLPAIVEIRDPVAGLVYVLDQERKVAHRIRLLPPVKGADQLRFGTLEPLNAPSTPPSSKDVKPDGTVVDSEYLGMKTIEGVEATGSRTVTTKPSAIKDVDWLKSSSEEIWTAPYFDVPVLSHSADTRGTEVVSKLVNISLSEPDPSLFSPPAGWTVIEESGTNVQIPLGPTPPTPKLMRGIPQM